MQTHYTDIHKTANRAQVFSQVPLGELTDRFRQVGNERSELRQTDTIIDIETADLLLVEEIGFVMDLETGECTREVSDE
ncbi:hypothetical protein KFU94_41695 [Chloroflexi bacterium TSY]|nr:hypothetical protein [Chloroflexi bacterium TSY]